MSTHTRSPLALALALAASLAAAPSSELDERITNGKLQADLGNWKDAAAAFEAVARDSQATAPQQWEALVRLWRALHMWSDDNPNAHPTSRVWTILISSWMVSKRRAPSS